MDPIPLVRTDLNVLEDIPVVSWTTLQDSQHHMHAALTIRRFVVKTAGIVALQTSRVTQPQMNASPNPQREMPQKKGCLPLEWTKIYFSFSLLTTYLNNWDHERGLQPTLYKFK